jgi:hypothetical protein
MLTLQTAKQVAAGTHSASGSGSSSSSSSTSSSAEAKAHSARASAQGELQGELQGDARAAFHRVILEYNPSMRSSDSQKSLILAIVGYTSHKGRSELKLLAIQSLTLLCKLSQPKTLAGYLGPSVSELRSSCLKALNSRARLRVKHREAVLELLATTFDVQPGIAERLLSVGHLPASPERKENEKPNLFVKGGILRCFVDILEDKNAFRESPGLLVKVMRILGSLWAAAPGFHNLAADFTNARYVTGFWATLGNFLLMTEDASFDSALGAKIDSTRARLAAAPDSRKDNVVLALERTRRRLARLLQQRCQLQSDRKKIRSWAFHIISNEVFSRNAVGAKQSKLDEPLAEVGVV